MSYSPEFYKAYESYIKEPAVRKSHDWIFDIIRYNNCFDYVVDFGCGVGEFKRYFRPRSYVGLDLNVEAFNIKKVDYRNCDLLKVLNGFKPLSFVSIFSSEITSTYNENYLFYERVFKETKILSGLVSGFYYTHKKNDPTAQEYGGLISYQTIEDIDEVESSVFTEKRIILPVPSKLFGDGVYEVWKIFTKRE